jgi:hypothetical protein
MPSEKKRALQQLATWAWQIEIDGPPVTKFVGQHTASLQFPSRGPVDPFPSRGPLQDRRRRPLSKTDPAARTEGTLLPYLPYLRYSFLITIYMDRSQRVSVTLRV